jgi:hypothetical protein
MAQIRPNHGPIVPAVSLPLKIKGQQKGSIMIIGELDLERAYIDPAYLAGVKAFLVSAVPTNAPGADSGGRRAAPTRHRRANWKTPTKAAYI